MRTQRMKPELLAPAGGPEQLKYAIRFGADAVYLAADRFGMRQRAANFRLDEIPQAVAFAHEHGVRIHATLNVVVHDHDLDDIAHYMQTLAQAGVDAFIIGDIGAARLAKTIAPDVDLHVSTQASVSNTQSALVWHELGAKRIVCARELSLADLAAMRTALPEELELEVFVHGAMCMAYSGRCLISDYLTGRSALEGHCTQSCRWHFTLEEEKRPGEHFPIEEDSEGSYILNAQDLNMLTHLDKICEAGIDSIKIEGRNKKAFYVASVVNAYRHVLDGADAHVFERELDLVSHRPYSTGFFFGPAHQATQSDERVQRVEWAAEVIDSRELADGTWQVDAYCRNAFSCRTELELLSPHTLPHQVSISELHLIKEDEEIPVEIANRAMDVYRFACDEKLMANDILRMPKV